MPVAFVGHGAPTKALDAEAGGEFRDWGQRLPHPRAILAISAHWQTSDLRLGATATRALVYDFYGFPDAMYRVRYPAPGAPELALRVTKLLESVDPVVREETRGLDHGVWTPLVHLFPRADVPILQLTLPRWPAQRLYELGRRLQPLREEGVLVYASGNLTHNLRMLGPPTGTTPAWAAEFDEWIAGTLQRQETWQLLDYRKAPGFASAHPTDEHFTPVIVAAGAAEADAVAFPVAGFEWDHLSKRCVQFG
jgi:4,5-DOPA dioxygenase extradiol